MPNVRITINDNEGAQFQYSPLITCLFFCNKVACLFSIIQNLENILLTRVRSIVQQMADVSSKAQQATTRCNVCTFANKRTKIVGKHQINSNSKQMSFNNRLRFNLISFSFNLMFFLSSNFLSLCRPHYVFLSKPLHKDVNSNQKCNNVCVNIF